PQAAAVRAADEADAALGLAEQAPGLAHRAALELRNDAAARGGGGRRRLLLGGRRRRRRHGSRRPGRDLERRRRGARRPGEGGERGQRRAAGGAGGRHLLEAVDRPAAAVGDDRAVRDGLLADRDEQLGVVEGRRLVLHPRVRQRLHERDEGVLLGVREAERRELLRRVGEVTAAAVEVDHLAQGQLTAVVEVRRGQRDVAQARRLEEARDPGAHAARRQRVAERIGPADSRVGGR